MRACKTRLLVWLSISGLFALVSLSSLFPEYGEICSQTKDTAPKDCATYDISRYALFKTFTLLQDYNGAVTALATVFIMILTITLAGVGREQMRQTKILQRAFLSVEPKGVHALHRVGPVSVGHIGIKNVGHLPARNVKWVIEFALSEDDRLNRFVVNEEAAEGDNVVSPGSEMRQGSGPIWTGGNQPDEKKIRRVFGRYLYVWGAVFYDDGFKSRRVTRFCHRYNCINAEEVRDFSGGLIGMAIPSEHARYHRYGNHAD
jgi:hypothetical protein